MKRGRHITTLVTVVVIIFGMAVTVPAVESAGAASHTLMVPANFSELATTVRDGVVNIRVEKAMPRGGDMSEYFRQNPFGGRNPFEDFFGPRNRDDNQPAPKQRGLGSGFIIGDDGYIVTNNHVVGGADEIIVTLSNHEEYEAELIGADEKTDLALIRIKDVDNLKPLVIGDSDDLSVGEWVVAIGSPFGLEQTVTAGIVSAKGRVIGAGPYDDFIQTDASINPGNSGGPLIDMDGKVIGINTAIVAGGQGIGFAIPINLARNIVEQLKNNGEVTRAWLGVGIQDVTDELADYYSLKDKKGVLVTEIFTGSPAEEGGILVEDVIVAVNGKTVSTGRELAAVIANTPVGKRVDVTVHREGRERTISVTVAKRLDQTARAGRRTDMTAELGVTLDLLTPETAERFGYNPSEKGVVIVNVKGGSTAEKSGLRPGDIIKGINNDRVESVDDVLSTFKKAEEGDTLRLLIKRGRAGFVVIDVKK